MSRTTLLLYSLFLFITALQSSLCLAQNAVTVTLAQKQKAAFPVAIAKSASTDTLTHARTLAAYLQKISGAVFEVKRLPGTIPVNAAGISLGTPQDYAQPEAALISTDPTKRENYRLRSHANGLTLMGATETALSHAVWDTLYRLGFRQFFPGKRWEIVPHTESLQIAVDTLEEPDYISRRIWYAYAKFTPNASELGEWNVRNRMGGVQLNTGHVYNTIIERNKAAFEAHPEYLALVKGKRELKHDAKFCVANPGLHQLVIDDALRQFEADPKLSMVSVEPSDGYGWCECAQCTKIGNISNRAITLANAVAEAVNHKFPGKFVGLYAYNEHSPPPTVRVHPQVVVSIATSFIKGGFTIDQLIEGWSQQADILGIREYSSVYGWDFNLPGQSRSNNYTYLKTQLPFFNARHARFFTSESTDSWGTNGVGFYLTSRILWDTNEANHIDALINDFVTRSFGQAREPMRKWIGLMELKDHKTLVTPSLIGQMYRYLDEAYRLNTDPAVEARLNDLALYTRYVELYNQYLRAKGAPRQTAYEQMARFSYRTRKHGITQVAPIWKSIPRRDTSIKHPEAYALEVAEKDNPWKSSEPYSLEAIQTFIREGIANNALMTFEPIAFSDSLVRATSLNLTGTLPGQFEKNVGETHFLTWIDKTPATITLQSQNFSERSSRIYYLYSLADVKSELTARALDRAIPGPNKRVRKMTLKTSIPGAQRIKATGATTATSWDKGIPMVIESSVTNPAKFEGEWSLYFYVPQGTKVVGGYGDGMATLTDGAGNFMGQIEVVNDYWNVPVPAGKDGQLWKFTQAKGSFQLMTVPPYLARSAAEMLVPEEVLKPTQ